MNKTAVEVAMGLVTRVFPYTGLPKILHSDNGREFVNELVRECLSTCMVTRSSVTRYPIAVLFVSQREYFTLF